MSHMLFVFLRAGLLFWPILTVAVLMGPLMALALIAAIEFAVFWRARGAQAGDHRYRATTT